MDGSPFSPLYPFTPGRPCRKQTWTVRHYTGLTKGAFTRNNNRDNTSSSSISSSSCCSILYLLSIITLKLAIDVMYILTYSTPAQQKETSVSLKLMSHEAIWMQFMLLATKLHPGSSMSPFQNCLQLSCIARDRNQSYFVQLTVFNIQSVSRKEFT